MAAPFTPEAPTVQRVAFSRWGGPDRPLRSSKGRRPFTHCPEHGPGEPTTVSQGYGQYQATITRQRIGPRRRADVRYTAQAACCGATVAMTLVEYDPRGAADPIITRDGRAYCNSMCLDGRVSCSCRSCEGACHGAGTCTGH